MADSIDEVPTPRKAKEHFVRYIRDELFTLNFYRAHMLYFIVVIAISSVIVYGEGVKNGPKDGYYDSHLSYMDALFLTCSAMTTTGTLNPLLMLIYVVKLPWTGCRVVSSRVHSVVADAQYHARKLLRRYSEDMAD